MAIVRRPHIKLEHDVGRYLTGDAWNFAESVCDLGVATHCSAQGRDARHLPTPSLDPLETAANSSHLNGSRMPGLLWVLIIKHVGCLACRL